MEMDWAELLGRIMDRFEHARSFQCSGLKVTDVLVQRFEIVFLRPRFCVRFSDAFVASEPIEALMQDTFDKQVGCGYLWVDYKEPHHARVEAEGEAAAPKLEFFPQFDMMLPVVLALPGYPSEGLSLRLLKDAKISTDKYANFPECFVVDGQLARPGDTQLWFEQRDFFPRRVIQKDRFSVMQQRIEGAMQSNEQTMQVASDLLFYNWKFNDEIEEKMLTGPAA
jgi:hypothetical protein